MKTQTEYLKIENTKSYKLLGVFAVWRFGCGQRNLKSAIRPPNWRVGENQSATVRSSSRIRPKCGGLVGLGWVGFGGSVYPLLTPIINTSNHQLCLLTIHFRQSTFNHQLLPWPLVSQVFKICINQI